MIDYILFKVKYTARHHPEGRAFKKTDYIAANTTDIDTVEKIVEEKNRGSKIVIKKILYKGPCVVEYTGNKN